MPVEFSLDPNDIKPLVETVVSELLDRFHTDEDRIAYSEKEAAALLGVTRTALRDERLRGRVEASKVGRQIRYTRKNLTDYLANRQYESQ